MRESRWRSMSIMDLNLTRRRSGSKSSNHHHLLSSSSSTSGGSGTGGSHHNTSSAMPFPASHSTAAGAGQSYELIKSTQVGTATLHIQGEALNMQQNLP